MTEGLVLVSVFGLEGDREIKIEETVLPDGTIGPTEAIATAMDLGWILPRQMRVKL